MSDLDYKFGPGGKPQRVQKGTRREVPVKYKFLQKVDWHRRLTFRERLLILFGFNCFVVARLVSQHNPGQCQPVVAMVLTRHHDPDEIHREHIQLIDRMDSILEGEPS